MQRLVAAHARLEDARSDILLHQDGFASEALKVANDYAGRNENQRISIDGRHRNDGTYVVEALARREPIGASLVAQIILDAQRCEVRFEAVGRPMQQYRFPELGEAINAFGRYVRGWQPEATAVAA
ncbi:MAG TPA: hypothetical protein VHO23_01245 [Candidatus Paceibacterota bacterium]|nr:hypothetical protein [Candidatus Paceibacterota bacterium]